MTEKRHNIRKNRRLEIRFGPDEPQRIGFTCDITPQGFFIQTAGVSRPGTLLSIAIHMGPGREVRLRGRVQWAKRVPPQLLRTARKGGMGIKIESFILGEDLYRAYCADIYG